MALGVLNCCSELEGQSVSAIATLAKLHQESTRAILKALEGKIVAAEVTPGGKLWRLSNSKN
jgi:DNA-binding IclR family transcriptional regulator